MSSLSPESLAQLNAIQNARAIRFAHAFPHNKDYLPMYLALREGGDSHSEAVQTVRGELMVAARMVSSNR